MGCCQNGESSEHQFALNRDNVSRSNIENKDPIKFIFDGNSNEKQYSKRREISQTEFKMITGTFKREDSNLNNENNQKINSKREKSDISFYDYIKDKDTLNNSFRKDKDTLNNSYRNDKNSLNNSYRNDKNSLNNSFRNDKGKLNNSFRNDKDKLNNSFRNDKDKLNNSFRNDKDKLNNSFRNANECNISFENNKTKGNELNNEKQQKQSLDNIYKNDSINNIINKDSKSLHNSKKLIETKNELTNNNQIPGNTLEKGKSNNDCFIKPQEDVNNTSQRPSKRQRKHISMDEKCQRYHIKNEKKTSYENILDQEEKRIKNIENNINRDKFRPIQQSKTIQNIAQLLQKQMLMGADALKPSAENEYQDPIINIIKQKPVIHKKKKKKISHVFE